MKYIISESEKASILDLYGIKYNEPMPLEKLSTCKYTANGKYVLYENVLYSCETGEEVVLNEAWTLSDILHAGADLVSAGLDFVIPGTGMVVDTLNGLSYLIEAQFKKPEEQSALYIMAAITFGFAIIPGAFQTIAIPLKRAIKTGVKFTSPILIEGIKTVAKFMDKILLGLPSTVTRALKSPLAKRILGKWGPKIKGIVDNFVKTAKQYFDNILITYNLKTDTKVVSKTATKVGAKTATKATLTRTGRRSLFNFFKRTPKIKNGRIVLKKAGFVPGRVYRYMGPKGMTTGTIRNVTDDLVTIVFKNGATTTFPINTFIRNAIGAPWVRRGRGVLVPLFVKRFSDMLLPDGSDINYNLLDHFDDLDPDMVSQETLDYMQEELSQYEGDIGHYNVNQNVQLFQTSLVLLGYPLPRFGIDGKFGPETMGQLRQFQIDNNLTSSLGKFDRITARKMAEILDINNVQNSEKLQHSLNSI
jgi:peptidoglycan hydrolase-like protein with peptidoglycan-binding domain